MNHQQYQPRQLHPTSQQNLYEIPTDDEIKQFKVQQLLKKQKPIDNLNNKELIEYSHNEWKLWMASLFELKKCMEKEKDSGQVVRQQEDKKAQLIQNSNQHNIINYPPPSQQQHSLTAQNMMLPQQYYQPSYQQVMHSQNLHYMRNNQPQSRPSYMQENATRPSFPFPYSPQMQMGQAGQGYGQGQMMGGRGMMMGQQGQQQMMGNQMNK